MRRAPFSSVGELLASLRCVEHQASEDVVPPLPHLLQTAAALGETHGEDPELVAAGLVHDVASALDPQCGDHARAGAELVGPLLGWRVASLVAGHTDAKRYLVTVEAGYAGTLSPNSTATLVRQGGPMTAQEVDVFRARPDWGAMVALRRADDGAKVPGRVVPALATWRCLLTGLADAATVHTGLR